MVRYSALLLTALLGLAVAGCSIGDLPPTPTPTPTPRPVTRYDNSRLGVKAILPGTAWEIVSGNTGAGAGKVAGLESTVGEIVGSKDTGRELLFVAWRVNDIPAPDAREMTDEEVLDLFESEFAADNFYAPPVVSGSLFKGFQARRVEGEQTKQVYPPNYHLTLYFFFPDETSVYMIGAGSKTADWEAGGKAEAEAILESVEIK